MICIGASVRAMAQSAARAGFAPICFDYFNDVDLLRCVGDTGGSAAKITGYDDTTLSLLNAVPTDVPLMYGGAVENYPDFVDRIAQSRPVWGATGEALRRCRDPWEVQRVAATFVTPLECRSTKPNSGDWVWKPYASGAGLDFNNPACGKPGYWQERVDGTEWSASSVSGWTFHRPIRHIRTATAHDYLYEPYVSEETVDVVLQPVVNASAVGFGLGVRGLCGADCVVTPDGSVHVVELNPRYTASMELIERAHQTSPIRAHAAACCGDRRFFEKLDLAKAGTRFIGKRIVFASQNVHWPSDVSPSVRTVVADEPQPETAFAVGDPVCTLIADGNSETCLADELAASEAQIRAHILG